MAAIKPGVLIITPFFFPNIGGVETHLSDLTTELAKQNYQVYVQTYSPLTTPENYQPFEVSKNLYIRRYRWFGGNLFHILEKYPLLDFLYLTPYLFIRTFLWLIANHKKIQTIHSHGFNAAFIGVIFSKIFHLRHITSTHAIYDHIGNLSQKLVRYTLTQTDHILCLSNASKKQLISWGVNPAKVSTYRYWIDLDRFSPAKLPNKFTFIFVGRLIVKKGINLYLKLAHQFPQFNFLVVGTGPELSTVKKCPDVQYHGTNPQYHFASALITPSLYAEGYGRVVMEAVACGLPVLASNLGGLPEALDNSVAILVKPSLKNFSQSIKKICQPEIYQNLQKNCRQYALNKFSSKNISLITSWYTT